MAALTVTSEYDIDDWLAQVKRLAMQGGMHVTQLNYADGLSQLLVVTQPLKLEPELAKSFFQRETRTPSEDNASAAAEAESLVPWVQDALKDLLSPFILSTNPLVTLLDLSPFREARDPRHIADGLALQRAIRQTVDAIAVIPAKQRSQLVKCFRMRFEDALPQNEVAAHWGNDPVTVRRAEHRLVQMIASQLAQFRAIS